MPIENEMLFVLKGMQFKHRTTPRLTHIYTKKINLFLDNLQVPIYMQ